MTSTTAVTLPSEAEYEAARRKFTEGYDFVESIEVEVRAVSKHWQEGDDLPAEIEVPTLEEIGRLYSFVSSVRSLYECMERELIELDVALTDLDCLRLDAESRAEKAAQDA